MEEKTSLNQNTSKELEPCPSNDKQYEPESEANSIKAEKLTPLNETSLPADPTLVKINAAFSEQPFETVCSEDSTASVSKTTTLSACVDPRLPGVDVLNRGENRVSPEVNRVITRKQKHSAAKEKKKSADVVIRYLTPFYKKGAFESKDLFKDFARRLTHLLSKDRKVTTKNGECRLKLKVHLRNKAKKKNSATNFDFIQIRKNCFGFVSPQLIFISRLHNEPIDYFMYLLLMFIHPNHRLLN